MKLRLPDRTVLFTSEGRFTPDASLTHRDVRVEYKLSEGGRMQIRITAEDTLVRFVRLRWLYTEEERMGGIQRVQGTIHSVPYGAVNRRFDPVMPEAYMPWYFFHTNATDAIPDSPGITRAFGVETGANAFCFWQNDTEGVTLWIDVRCGARGVHLGGRTLEAATVLFREYSEADFTPEEKKTAGNVFLACEHFCRLMCKSPLHPKQPVYGANNWYYAYGNSSHAEILADAAFLAKMTEGLANRPYMVIDDGWQKNGTTCTGPWDRGNEKFPDMAALAKEITALGVKPGIWYRPLSDRHREATWATDEMRSRLNPDRLDPSHPTVLAHVKEDMARLVSFGYTLIKHDYSTYDMLGYYKLEFNNAPLTDDPWAFYDTEKTSAEIVLGFYRALREAAGEHAMIMYTNPYFAQFSSNHSRYVIDLPLTVIFLDI